MRRTFDLPPLKEGHRYRLLVGGSSHVGVGDGYCVYLNGRKLLEATRYEGRGSGGLPDGAFTTADFYDEFKDGKVVVAATGFLRIHHRTRLMHGNRNLWFQEMKVPPMGDELVHKSAELISMACSAWQDLQDPDKENVDPEEGKFRYDGTFTANKNVTGAWTPVDRVAAIEAFVPGEKQDKRFRPTYASITFKEDGKTDQVERIWSGDTLMDLDRFQALKMTVKAIDGEEYLFIESGGFSTRHPAGWKSPLVVLKRE